MHFYIPMFWCGVIATILVELGFCVLGAILVPKKKEDDR